jgi:hypothetical protein
LETPWDHIIVSGYGIERPNIGKNPETDLQKQPQGVVRHLLRLFLPGLMQRIYRWIKSCSKIFRLTAANGGVHIFVLILDMRRLTRKQER